MLLVHSRTTPVVGCQNEVEARESALWIAWAKGERVFVGDTDGFLLEVIYPAPTCDVIPNLLRGDEWASALASTFASN